MRRTVKAVKIRTNSRAARVLLCLDVSRCWMRWSFWPSEKLLFKKCFPKTLVVEKKWLWSACIPIVFHGEAVEENAMHVGLIWRLLRESSSTTATI